MKRYERTASLYDLHTSLKQIHTKFYRTVLSIKTYNPIYFQPPLKTSYKHRQFYLDKGNNLLG